MALETKEIVAQTHHLLSSKIAYTLPHAPFTDYDAHSFRLVNVGVIWFVLSWIMVHR